ncbi:MAG TPA: 4-hydroxythreonine-4-phosphate dehydrogenase PdxA [Steroidobacteraceae bacterium]|nr:4-hydroxythreonine-4-phosphate dehydrogenase PdxA [Steroidobacteraceae bacterium]
MAAAHPRRGLRRAAPLIAPIALSAGEPAGIGPELCLAAAQQARSWPLVCIADRALLAGRAQRLHWTVRLHDYVLGQPVAGEAGHLCVLHQPLAAPSVPGQLEPANAPYVLALIDRAVDGCVRGEFSALVTAPVQKSLLCDAGVAFSGHTEYIALRTHAPRPVMMLAAGSLRVALATTHLALRDVSAALNTPDLLATLLILAGDLRRCFGIERPRIAVCGLNPHAGEAGHLGDEELRIIAPAIRQARAHGLVLEGPLPADTVFVPRHLAAYDAVLAMYHDQGLPVLKALGFGHAVNVTLGLPIVRTSVDHGTALDLAGTGHADVGSLLAAIALAAQIATRVQPGGRDGP